MSLLSLSEALYVQALKERKPTDAMVQQLRSFLTTHFGHEGTKVINKAAGTPQEFKRPARAGASTFGRFQHPAAAGAPARPMKRMQIEVPKDEDAGEQLVGLGPVAPPAEKTGEQGTPPAPPAPPAEKTGADDNAFANSATPGKPEPQQGTQGLPAQEPGNENPLSGSQTNEAAAAGKQDEQAKENPVSKDAAIIAKMSPKAVAAAYTLEDIKAYLAGREISFNPKGSHTQLAAHLVSILKQE